MENDEHGPFPGDLPINNGDFPWLCDACLANMDYWPPPNAKENKFENDFNKALRSGAQPRKGVSGLQILCIYPLVTKHDKRNFPII